MFIKRIKNITLVSKNSYKDNLIEIVELINNPKDFMKEGTKCTVYANEKFVIKRYNQCSLSYFFKQNLGLGRARKTFEVTQSLHKKKIAVSNPVAYGSQKKFFFKTAEYFIAERVEGRTLAAVLEDDSLSDGDKLDLVIVAIDFLNILWMADMVHGDLKPHNIMIGLDDEPYFIDLDQTVKSSPEGLLKDKQRFLKNFKGMKFYETVKVELCL